MAESGGTKTQWYRYDREGLQGELRTGGLNPNASDDATLAAQLRAEWSGIDPAAVTELDFYGAGLGAPSTEARMTAILQAQFPQARLRLYSDLVAAARATAGDQLGIVCILGTGSNCCHWDGRQVTASLGSHGYLFNDEGSGADLGRALVGAALNGELPHDVEHMLRHWTGKPILEVRSEIYQAPKVSAALADYSRFLAEHLDHPTLRTIVVSRFMAFFTRTVFRIRGYQQTPLHFVGSIAEVYAGPLREALAMMHLQPASIVAAPAEALLAYHVASLPDA